MLRSYLFVLALCSSLWGYSQKGINSPYSYYGLGVKRFSGNIENALMGGISAYADSTRVDVRNPASLGKLKLTTYALGVSYDIRSIKGEGSSYMERTFQMDYLSLSFPVYKGVGVSVGLQPYSSIGYRLSTRTETTQYLYEGSGGVNRAYLAVGAHLYKGLRLGVSGAFDFGKANYENQYGATNLLYPTREESESLFRGGSYSLGLQYERDLNQQYFISSGVSYTPKGTIRTTNSRSVSTLRSSQNGLVQMDKRTFDLGELARTHLTTPSELTLSAGMGKQQQWFVGADISFVNLSECSNPFVTSDFVTYNNGYKLSVGGFYLPHYSAYSKYWKRITYRAGFYYESTGISLRDTPVNDFGITFGASLPIQGFSNVTLGGVWGSKGQTSLAKENYFALKVALTLNDKWFQRSRYH